MKKRAISFVLVFIFIFSGAFSCIASADDGAVRKYYDLYKKYFQSLFGLSGELIWDQSFFGDLDDLIDLVGDQQDATDQHDDLDSSLFGYGRLQNVSYFSSGLEHTNWDDGVAVLPDKALKCTIDPHSEFSFFPYCNDFRAYEFQFYHSDQSRYSGWQRYNVSGKSPFIQTNKSDSPLFLYVRFGVVCNDGPIDLSSVTVYLSGGIHWGWDSNEIVFSGTSSEIPGTINLYLTASRDIIPDIDGSYMIGFGLLYDDGNDRMYCGDYIDFRNVSNGDYWESSFNLKEFSQYAYRKRCPLDNYKAFIFVFQDGFVYNIEFPIDLDLPDGIFEDTQPPPDWKDYEPDPFEPPEPPTLDTNIFNFTFNTNNYTTYNFQTIQNFSYSGGGSGGSGGGGGGGGTGNDDSSVPDYSSSGGDSSGGDSSLDDSGSGSGVNINPEIDFDFGLLTAFLNWFADAFAALLGNLTGFFGAMLNNFKLLLDNLFTFINDFSDFITGTFNDWLEYFSQLIINFNTDFTNWGNSFATYIGDCIDITDFNIQIVVSNLKQYFDTQFIPDSDNVNFILSDCLGWYYQIQQLLSSKSYSSTVFTLSLGDLGTFTLDDPQLFLPIRSLIGVIVMGFTAIKCLRLGFQMFGINIGGGDSDDS